MKVTKIEKAEQYYLLMELVDLLGLQHFDIHKKYIPKYRDKCISFRIKNGTRWFRYRWKFSNKLYIERNGL